MKPILFALLLSAGWYSLQSQDTFSIVAVDSITGEVGSAGASCVAKSILDNLGWGTGFLGDLHPGYAAANSQSYYLTGNQQLLHDRLAAGDTPQQALDYVVANDIEGNATQRQYGVAGLVNGSPQSAAFTGTNCLDYKGHITGPNYAIQGNILLGPAILDSMEARFLNTPGCLSDKLMAALQGANVPGADSRCLDNGTSSLFAFLKVAQPGDNPANPSLLLGVAYNADGIEPIDSLQALYDAVACEPPVRVVTPALTGFSVYPNPATSGELMIMLPTSANPANWELSVKDLQGKVILETSTSMGTAVLHIPTKGVFIVSVNDGQGRSGQQKVVVL